MNDFEDFDLEVGDLEQISADFVDYAIERLVIAGARYSAGEYTLATDQWCILAESFGRDYA